MHRRAAALVIVVGIAAHLEACGVNTTMSSGTSITIPLVHSPSSQRNPGGQIGSIRHW